MKTPDSTVQGKRLPGSSNGFQVRRSGSQGSSALIQSVFYTWRIHGRELAKDPRCISSSLGRPWLMLLALLLLQLHPLYLVPHQIPRFS